MITVIGTVVNKLLRPRPHRARITWPAILSISILALGLLMEHRVSLQLERGLALSRALTYGLVFVAMAMSVCYAERYLIPNHIFDIRIDGPCPIFSWHTVGYSPEGVSS